MQVAGTGGLRSTRDLLFTLLECFMNLTKVTLKSRRSLHYFTVKDTGRRKVRRPIFLTTNVSVALEKRLA